MKNLIEFKANYYNEFLEKRVVNNYYEVEWIEDGVIKTKFFDTKQEAESFIDNL